MISSARPKPVRGCCRGREAELGLNGFAVHPVACVARVVVDALAVVVTEVMGHLSVEGTLEQRLRQLLQEAVLAEQVFGVLVGLEQLVNELRVDGGVLGHGVLRG